MDLTILSPGLNFTNSRALIFPFIIYAEALKDRGISVTVASSAKKITSGDILLVDSKYHREYWNSKTTEVFADFCFFKTRFNKVVYCDTTDSTGGIQVELLEQITQYWKFQALKDRLAYTEPLYGGRVHTNYVYDTFRVLDREPIFSKPIKDLKLLQKIKVCWNSALLDYSLIGHYTQELYCRVPIAQLLKMKFPKGRAKKGHRRDDVFSRFNCSYSRETVSWQREKMKKLLGSTFPADRVSKRIFFKELKNSKVVVSPFGFGEICYRDFECFLGGALLLKPSMEHMETWPNLYIPEITYMPCSWDLTNFKNVLEEVLDNYGTYSQCAAEGHRLFSEYNSQETGGEHFVHRLSTLLVDI